VGLIPAPFPALPQPIPVRRRQELNDALKDAGVCDTPPWRSIQHLSDIRNLCDHGRDREPSAGEVDDLLRGIAWAAKTLF
jgi:hypothetical protein